MKGQNKKKRFLSSSILDKNYIFELKKEFENIVEDNDESEPTTLEYIESVNDYFLKYPNE